MIRNTRGFTLVEVMIALIVIGMGLLAVQMMQVRSVDENAKSGWMSIKSMQAAAQVERIMNLKYDDNGLLDTDGDGTNQDNNFDGIDDQDDGNVNTVTLNEQFGLRQSQCCPGLVDPRGNAVPGCTQVADQCAFYEEFDVYWNIAVDVPVLNTKTVNIIVVNQHDKLTGIANRPEMLHRSEYKFVKDDTI